MPHIRQAHSHAVFQDEGASSGTANIPPVQFDASGNGETHTNSLLDHLGSAIHKRIPLAAKQISSMNAGPDNATDVLLDNIRPVITPKPATSEKKTNTISLDTTTPKSSDLLTNAIQGMLKKLTNISPETPEPVQKIKENILNQLTNLIGISNAAMIRPADIEKAIEKPQLLTTVDGIIRNREYAEALDIQDSFFFNRANTGKDALDDIHTGNHFQQVLDKLSHIPVYNISQKRAKVNSTPATEVLPYGNLGDFLSTYTVPHDNQLKKGSTLIGALTFKHGDEEQTFFIIMNSGRKRFGYDVSSDQKNKTPQSKRYIAYLNFTSSEPPKSKLKISPGEASSSHTETHHDLFAPMFDTQEPSHLAGAEAIIYDRPNNMRVSKDDFLNWILTQPDLNNSEKQNARPKRLIHVCAKDLIDFQMLETEAKIDYTRQVPRLGTMHTPVVEGVGDPASDKENHPRGNAISKAPRDNINHRIYDTEHMMLTLAHALGQHIEKSKRAKNPNGEISEVTMKISLISSFKACISCTSAISTLPFNNQFKNLRYFFTLDTHAHDYRIATMESSNPTHLI